jgi:hypothetical protein
MTKYWLGKKIPKEIIQKILETKKRKREMGIKIASRSEESRQKMRDSWVRMKKRGIRPPTHNIKHSDESKEKMRLSSLKRFENVENHPRWTGKEVKYHALHHWIYKVYGKAYKCENKKCIYPRKDARGKMMDKPKRFEWAKKHGFWTRDRSGWLMLCVSCHHRYDNNKIEL